jgi:hypothetical protein
MGRIQAYLRNAVCGVLKRGQSSGEGNYLFSMMRSEGLSKEGL